MPTDDEAVSLPKTFTYEMEFKTVSPDLLGLLTGGALGTPPKPTFSLEMFYDIPWKWWQWQWWLRRPKRKGRTFLPNVEMVKSTEVTDA